MRFTADVERWRGTVQQHFKQPDVDKALWTIRWESNGDPSALGDGGSAVGLFQIHSSDSIPGRPTRDWLLVPENNVQYAAKTLGAADGNWKPWGEKNLFEGARFGSLGWHPWPGGLEFTRLPVDGFPVTGKFFQTDDVWTPGNPHRGLDFGCPANTPVYAPAPGKVVNPANDGSFGTAVCLDHTGTPWYSLYAHLTSASVKLGQQVSTGDFLGYSGGSGRVTGDHLHWQVCFSKDFPTDISQSADPLAFFNVEGGEEDDMAETTRWKIMQTAFGDFARMTAAYDLLRSKGLVPDDGLPNFNYGSNRLSDIVSNLNNAMVRRTRIAEAAAGDKAQEVYDTLKRGN